MANRHIAERYASALASWDLTSLKDLVHPDIVVRYPQSGETFEGIDNYLATIEEYPGLPGMGEVSSGSSARESVIVTQSFPFTAAIVGFGISSKSMHQPNSGSAGPAGQGLESSAVRSAPEQNPRP